MIPYWAFYEKVCILSDGTLFTSLKLTGVDALAMTDSALSEYKNKLQNCFAKLPSGYVVQIYHDMHTNNEDNISELEEKLSSKNPISTRFKSHYIDHLKKDAFLMNVDVYIFVIVPGKKRTRDMASFFQAVSDVFNKIKNRKDKKSKEVSLVDVYNSRHADLLLHTENIIISLNNYMNIEATLLDEYEVYSFIYKILNPQKPFFVKKDKANNKMSHKNYFYKYLTMREFLTHTPADEKSASIKMEDKQLAVITLKVPSEYTDAFVSENILYKLNFPFFWSFNFTIVNTESKNASLRGRQRRKYAAQVAAENPNIESSMAKNEIEQALFDQHDKGFMWHDFSLSFLIYADSEKELKIKTNKLIGVFRDNREAVLAEEKHVQLEYFIASLPGCGHLNDRQFLFSSLNVSDLAPISVPPKGTKALSCFFHTYRNTLFRFSTFTEEFNNFNHVVIGKTGSGKSFAVNSILNMSLMGIDHPRVMILDLGQSFKRTTKLWGGEYMTIDLNCPDSNLNPLPPRSMLFEGCVTNQDFMEFTLQLIMLMLRSDSKEVLKSRVVRVAIMETYNRLGDKDPIMQDLFWTITHYNQISDDQEDIGIARYLAKIMEDFVDEGSYSRLFNGHSTLNLASDFFCFDFKNAGSDERIREIATYIVGGYMVRKMTQNSFPKFIIFDEFSTTMKHETGKALCDLIAKNCRKYGTSFICISQKISDFRDNPAAQTVLSQSNYKWFLKMDDELSGHKEHLGINDTDVRAIKNLQYQKGYFSEVYLKYDQDKTRLAIKPDPLMYWACTTDPWDKLLLEAYENSFADMKLIDLLEKLAARYPRGIFEEQLMRDEHYKLFYQERDKLCA